MHRVSADWILIGIDKDNAEGQFDEVDIQSGNENAGEQNIVGCGKCDSPTVERMLVTTDSEEEGENKHLYQYDMYDLILTIDMFQNSRQGIFRREAAVAAGVKIRLSLIQTLRRSLPTVKATFKSRDSAMCDWGSCCATFV